MDAVHAELMFILSGAACTERVALNSVAFRSPARVDDDGSQGIDAQREVFAKLASYLQRISGTGY